MMFAEIFLNLQVLDLSTPSPILGNNYITCIEGISNLTHLLKLNLSHNRINNISNLPNLQKLVELILRSNSIRKV